MSKIVQAVWQSLSDADITTIMLESIDIGHYCMVYSNVKHIMVYYVDGVIRVQIWGGKVVVNNMTEQYAYEDGCDFDIRSPDCFDNIIAFLRRFL